MPQLFLTVYLSGPADNPVANTIETVFGILIGAAILWMVVTIIIKARHQHKYAWREVSPCHAEGICSCGQKSSRTTHDWVETEEEQTYDGGAQSYWVKVSTCRRCREMMVEKITH